VQQYMQKAVCTCDDYIPMTMLTPVCLFDWLVQCCCCYYTGVSEAGVQVHNTNNTYRHQRTLWSDVAIQACPNDCSTHTNSGFAVDIATNVDWLKYTAKVGCALM
jgi:hypothetical protein